MRSRWQGPVALLGLCALLGLLVGCGKAANEDPSQASHPDRERVLAFWGHLRAATAARIARDHGKAAGLYEQALALDAAHEDALYYLGYCRRELGQPQAARAAFERLVEVNPMSARGHMALGALLASPDPAEPMQLDEAERHLRRAHEINGEETGPVVRLGEVLLVVGRRDEAVEWFEAALRTNPKSVEAALLVGYLGRDEQGGSMVDALVERVREAAKLEKPVRGVLGEGDRRHDPPSGETAHAVAAPPLESPLGRLLFEDPVLALRSRAADSGAVRRDDVLEAWRQVDKALLGYEARARGDSRPQG